MSIYDKASLVLIPSGTKTSKVYSQKPTNGDGDFTFSRSTAATRVNASGNIEKETSNLLLQSNGFDTTWVNSNTTETGGQSGYDGTSDAWLITKSAAYANVAQSVSASGVNTYSVYAKANTLNWLRIVGGSTSAYFDLSNGVVGSTDVGNIAKMTSIGSGWYRCEVAMNASTTIMRIYPAQADNDVTGTSGSIYIQDAQLEQSLVARDVITTTTTAIYGGITDNVPRLDYTDSSCPALLLEPQRSNLLIQSEYFNGWAQINTITTDNSINSPEGVQNAAKLVASSGYSNKVIYQGITANTYTASVFAKKGELEGLVIATGTTGAFFNLNTQSFRADYSAPVTSYKIENYGNGWFRYSITFTEAGANNLYIGPNDNVSTSLAITGDGTSGIYIYGATLEAGSYATSYIPTYGSAVTRNADAASKTGISDLINDSEGTLFVEASTLENGADCRITISDNTINNRVSIEWDANADTIKGFIGVGGNLQTTSYDQTNMNKIALVYNATDARLFINGTKVFTDSSVPSLSGMDRLEFSNYAAALPFVGNTNKLLILKEKLTDQEAIDLTTI